GVRPLARAGPPSFPVLLLVGTFEPFDEAQARAAGADAHLKKPFDSQELLTLVQQLLRRPPAAGPVAPVAVAPPEPTASAQASPAAPPAPLAAAMAAWENFE